MTFRITFNSEQLTNKGCRQLSALVQDKQGEIVGRLDGEVFPNGIKLNRVWFGQSERQAELIMSIADQIRIKELGDCKVNLAG